MPPLRIGLVVGLVIGALLAGCTDSKSSSSKSPPTATTPPKPAVATPLKTMSLHQLRNLGKVHAERDTPEGFQDGVDVFREVVARVPSSVDDLLNLARCVLLGDGDATEGLTLVQRARQCVGATDLAARVSIDYLEALFFKRLKQNADALISIRRVARERSDLAQVLYQHGLIAEQNQEFDEAIRAYEQLLELDGRFRAAAYRIVQIHQRQGDRDAAKSALARWNAIPADQTLDTERCELTLVRRVPIARASSEPLEPTLTWTNVTARYPALAALEGVTAVLPARDLPPEAPGDALWIAGAFGLRRARVDGSIEEFDVPPIEGAAAAGDLDNDGREDLVVRADGEWRVYWRRETDLLSTPLPADLQSETVHDVRIVDLDHDGDLDLAFATNGEVKVVEHDGKRGFTLKSPFIGSGPGTAAVRFDFHDFDQGSDIDFAFPRSAETTAYAYLNLRSSFRPQELPSLGTPTVVRCEDLDNDRAPDLVAAVGATVRCVLNGDRDGIRGKLRLKPPTDAEPNVGRIHDLRLSDIDADGDFDVFVAGEKGVALLRNRAGGSLQADMGLPFRYGSLRLTTADVDGDGREEVISVNVGGKIEVVDVNAMPSYAVITVLPDGRRDNKPGIGAVVEVYSGKRFTSAMVKDPTGLRIGLGVENEEALDGIIVLWPMGIRQSEHDNGELVKNSRIAITQKEGLMASCPFLYARGPEGWNFVTDVVGIAPLDEWLPPGGTPHRDPEEYVRVPGDRVAIEDGKVQFAITEELRETTYLDRVELVWVDHPATSALVSDESSRQGKYDPLAFWIYDREALFTPKALTVMQNGNRVDQTALVSTVDRQFSHGYTEPRTQWSGWVPAHATDFTTDRPTQLILLSGRIAWYDSTTVYALAQNKLKWGPLALYQREGSSLREIFPDFGFPAGMDRTMVAEFDSPLPPGSFRLRGHHRFLWDRIAFVEAADRVVISAAPKSRQAFPAGEVISGRVAPQSAELGYHGYSAIIGDRARHEQTYDYDNPAPSDEFPRATGLATRYGKVIDLVRKHDDQVVVLVAGDQVTIDFEVPPIGEGQRRTYFLKITGWAKEGSFHNSTGRDIAPLPYRAMESYPPVEARDDAEYRRYLDEYQIRVVR